VAKETLRKLLAFSLASVTISAACHERKQQSKTPFFPLKQRIVPLFVSRWVFLSYFTYQGPSPASRPRRFNAGIPNAYYTRRGRKMMPFVRPSRNDIVGRTRYTCFSLKGGFTKMIKSSLTSF